MSQFILLLSGDIFTYLSLEDEFARIGIKTFGATNADEARETLIEQRSDILGIFCDIDFAYLEERALFPPVPVIMLTSGEEVDSHPLATIMRKPATPVEIVKKMSYTLRGSKCESLQVEGKKACAAG